MNSRRQFLAGSAAGLLGVADDRWELDAVTKLAGQVLRSLGLDLTRPSVCQTGAIDRCLSSWMLVGAMGRRRMRSVSTRPFCSSVEPSSGHRAPRLGHANATSNNAGR